MYRNLAGNIAMCVLDGATIPQRSRKCRLISKDRHVYVGGAVCKKCVNLLLQVVSVAV